MKKNLVLDFGVPVVVLVCHLHDLDDLLLVAVDLMVLQDPVVFVNREKAVTVDVGSLSTERKEC